jgi:hypothetical protein
MFDVMYRLFMLSLKEAIRLEAGFAAFWGKEYADKVCIEQSGFEQWRLIYVLGATLDRAQDDIRREQENKRNAERIAELQIEAEARDEEYGRTNEPEDPDISF